QPVPHALRRQWQPAGGPCPGSGTDRSERRRQGPGRRRTHPMSRRLSWDIHTRTQIISLGPALLLTLLLISFFTFVRIQDLRQELNHTGQLIANQLAPASEYGVISGNNEVLESLMRATLSIPHVRFLEVQDSRNHILVYVEQGSENS